MLVGVLMIMLIALLDIVLMLRAIILALEIFDRHEMDKIAKNLAKQLEEEKAYEEGKHAIK